MLTSLHPICLMARTDAELTTLFHSFYLMEYLPEAKDTRVVQRFPQDKPQIDTIESGLKLFIINGISNATTSETTGKFVFTSSDSSRYFAFFRSFDTKVFVSVSNLPTMSFSRTLFELLQHEPIESIPSILLTLCEIPIFPAVGMKYDIVLSNGTASLKFSCVEQVEDVDIDYIVLNVMTPAMLVKAWEAIILEKKVLVISNTDSIITACVEFLRRMMSPLVIVNTYVPLLPLQLIETVDAPVPYLLGSNTRMLKDNVFDLSDTVVVDLDTRSVTQNINKSGKPETHASINLISRLTQEVNDVMVVPLGEWSHRATNAYAAHSPCSPFSEEGYVTRGAKVLQVFRKANLDLISARNCSVKAFWRRAAETTLQNATNNASSNALATTGGATQSTGSSQNNNSGAFGRKNSTMMGFNYQDGVCSGFMQLAKELNIHDDENISHFTPCWVELDQYVLSIYQYADDLPVLYILLKDIETISPCAIEPEGHVFELVIKDQMSYRFTVTDTESRQKWISTLDRRKQYDFSGYNDDNMLLDVNYSTKMRLNSYEEPNVDLGYSTVATHTTQSNNNTAPTGVSLWNGYELVTKPIVSDVGVNSSASGVTTADNTPISEHGTTSTGSTVSLGLPLPCPPVYTESAAYLAKSDNLFRFEFSRTQTMNFIHQKLECGEFQDVFKEMKIKTESLIGSEYCLDANLDVVLSSCYQNGEEGGDRSATLSITEANTLANAGGGGGSPIRERTNSDGAIDKEKSDYVAPSLHRTSTSFGGAAAATVTPAVKQRLSSKMFGGFFKKLTSPEDEHAANLKLEQEREAEAEALRQKQISGRKKAALQSQIFVVTATYRRTQSELNALIVESRQAALQDLVLQYVHQTTTHDAPSPHATVTFPMRALLQQLKHTPVIVKSPKKDRSRGGSGVINMPAVNKTADVPLSSVPSSAWMDHLWLGLINKSYEEYRRDNPYTALNQEVDMQDHDAEGNTESTELMRLSTVEIDEFILDAERTKNERITRRQIREILLSHLTKHHESNLPRPEYAPYSCIRNVLIGYLHETLDSSALALQYYSKGGCLVEQRRLMSCLVQQFLVHIDKLKLIVVSEPSSPHLGHSTNHHNSGMLNSMSALSTILATYTNQSNSTAPPVLRFLEHCKTISPLIGMHAYRLVLELLYTDLVHRLEAFFDKDQVHVNKELELGSFRTFPGSHRNVGAAQQSSARSRVKSSTLLNSDFEYTTGDPKSEAINNAITCLSIKVERTPGDLSVLLLTELKEILKTYCQSPAGLKNSKKASHGFCKLKLTPAAIEDLSSTSAYKAFEQHCCILQKVEPVGLSINERVQFWCNIYNTITVHSIISRGSPGNTLLERSAFMRSSKYNIGGVLHSLLDIEHGILRHASTKPMLFGPLTVNLTFAERDPRRKQVLEEPRPNISFVLCNACVTSPALVVLKDADIIAEEMKYYARRFFHEFVKLDPVNKTITLPGLMRVYWADFGGGRAKVLRTIAQLSGSQFASELKPYFSPVEGLRAKVEFAKLDWTPLLSISD